MTDKGAKMHLPKVTLDEFLSTQEERDSKNFEKIQNISIMEITNFPNHPFKVRDDGKMFETMESIMKYGVLVPAIVRPKNGKYEMVSGHRRKRACELAKIKEIPCIVRNLTDDEATIIMVDSNLQREEILPSEKAFAYKMKLDAIKRQGQRNDLTSTPVVEKLSIEIIAKQVGESREQVRRYIRLTELIPELLKMVDEGRIKLRPAVEISYLTKDEQLDLLDAIECLESTPSHDQTIRMRKKSENGELTTDEINRIMEEEKPNQREQIKFKYEKVKSYFPKGYTVEKMQNVIEKLLQKYQLQWQKAKNSKDDMR